MRTPIDSGNHLKNHNPCFKIKFFVLIHEGCQNCFKKLKNIDKTLYVPAGVHQFLKDASIPMKQMFLYKLFQIKI